MTSAIRIEHGDVLDYQCDVLVMKYAQARYGTDEAVARALAGLDQHETSMRPQPGGFRMLDSRGAVSARFVMFAGVDPLQEFGYRQIRVFARKTMEDLAGRDPTIRRLAFTMHGAGYGLDEREAFESLVAGLLDALESGDAPSGLVDIAIVERNPGRARRLTEYLSQLLAGNFDLKRSVSQAGSPTARERLREVGYSSDSKPQHRADRPDSPYDIVLGGATPGDLTRARAMIGPLAEAGATWWDERQLQTSDDLYRLEPILHRIAEGPPVL